ncbi:MAG: hypothetical protein AAFX65_10545 [Cyanobacteria bacterium J06638_7]
MTDEATLTDLVQRLSALADDYVAPSMPRSAERRADGLCIKLLAVLDAYGRKQQALERENAQLREGLNHWRTVADQLLTLINNAQEQ